MVAALFYDSVHRFTLPAFVALLLTRWRVACTAQEGGSHHGREGSSQMVREEFIRHAERQCRAPCKFCPQGPLTFVQTRALPTSIAAATGTGGIGVGCVTQLDHASR